MHSHLMQIIFGFHYYRFSAEFKPIYFRLAPKVKQEQNHFSPCGTYELNLSRHAFMEENSKAKRYILRDAGYLI